MPAMLDDPTAAVIYRTSGEPPYPAPYSHLSPEITPRQVTLRDRITTATLVPFSSPDQVPIKLTAYLCELLNREIEKGDTYPMINPLPLASFGPYWFANFGAVMMLGDINSTEEVRQMEENGKDWEKECLGSFYIKPNYPGRSSHVCNGGFLVTDAARNRGVGRLMGEGYLEWAPRLGYTYSVFNLVYETNVASLRIWDALGFKRIGRVKGCGNLKSYPDTLIDAIIFGRELGTEGDDYVSEERFDKIKFYLKTGTYPNGSDRAEKSRLRSAATHYRLAPGDTPEAEEKLMLKGKEVVPDPHKQYEIARNVHGDSHGGINKTTATIAEKFHWVRIKETVSLAIRNCAVCQENAPKISTVGRSETTAGVKRTALGEYKPGAMPIPRIQRTSDADPTDGRVIAGASEADNISHVNHSDLHSNSHDQGAVPMADMSTYKYGTPLDPRLMNHVEPWHPGMTGNNGDYQVPDGYGRAHDEEMQRSMHHEEQVDDDQDAAERLRRDLEVQIMKETQGAVDDWRR